MKLFGKRKTDLEKAEDFFDLGKKYFDQANWDKAIESLNDCLLYSQNQPDVLFMLGTSYYKINDNFLAETNLKKCLELKPDHSEANFNLGIILGKQGNSEGDNYIKKAARLGNIQARELLRQWGVDY